MPEVLRIGQSLLITSGQQQVKHLSNSVTIVPQGYWNSFNVVATDTPSHNFHPH